MKGRATEIGDREGERENSSSYNIQIWIRLRNSILVPHMSDECPGILAIFTAFPSKLAGSWLASGAARTQTSTVIADVNIVSSSLTHCATS